MLKKDKYNLGIIELSDSVVVSDPCYHLGIWCSAILEKIVKPGKYHGFMNKADTSWGRRVTDLWVVHEDYLDIYPNDLDEKTDIGVDSGGAGIFDFDYYNKYHPVLDDDGPSSQWYDRQFDLRYYYDINGEEYIKPKFKYDPKTDKEEWVYSGQERRDGISLDGKCVVSFSGYGDGGYNLYTTSDKDGKIIGIRIEFIGDNDEYEDENE